MGKTKAKSQADIDWENRTLCSDGSCIGIIGPDGRCKECGKISKKGKQKDSRQAQTEPRPDTILAEDDTVKVKEDVLSQPDDEAVSQEGIDWENRTLCSDESCIGVIGPGGRCKECGKVIKK